MAERRDNSVGLKPEQGRPVRTNPISRRTFLVLGLMAGAALFGESILPYPVTRSLETKPEDPLEGSSEDYFPTDPQKNTPHLTTFNSLNPVVPSPVTQESLPSLINQTLGNLAARPFSDQNLHAKAVSSNLAFCASEFTRPNGKGATAVTCLRINEIGFYLTAAHAFSTSRGERLEEARVFNADTGSILPVRLIAVDECHDLSVFYAPTGQGYRLPQNLRLSEMDFRPGQRLWQYAIARQRGFPFLDQYNNVQAWLWQTILAGHVDNPIYDMESVLPRPLGPIGLLKPFCEQIRVKGMIPFGGSSGAPIIDRTGTVVAVESKFYIQPQDPNKRELYLGSTISPLPESFSPKLKVISLMQS